jgi:hypothetical protein
MTQACRRQKSRLLRPESEPQSEKGPQATFSHELRTLHENTAGFLPDVERADGFVSGRSERITGTQIEAGPVPWADDLALLDLSASEAFTIVSAAVFYREQALTAAGNDDRITVYFGAERRCARDGLGGPNVDPLARHQNMPVCRRAASDIID